jgi:hypothetical protein
MTDEPDHKEISLEFLKEKMEFKRNKETCRFCKFGLGYDGVGTYKCHLNPACNIPLTELEFNSFRCFHFRAKKDFNDELSESKEG